MGKRIMHLELSAEDRNQEHRYAELMLPTSSAGTEKALRTLGVSNGQYVDVSVLRSPFAPELERMRFDTASLKEMNLLAKRLHSLDEVSLTAFRALAISK